MSSTRPLFLPICLLLVATAGFLVYSESYTHTTNGSFGFPLDDAWIHLQFAKNLHDYGSYSYYKSEMVTAGSTSPLYTLLLAIGFFFTSNEFILSYFLGIIFLLAAGMLFFLILQSHGIHWIVSLVGTAALLLEPRLQWAALSGMETTLFLFMLLLVFYSYEKKKRVLLGVSAGLLLWTRPEAILFAFVIFTDLLYHRYWVRGERTEKKKPTRSDASPGWVRAPLMIFLVFLLGYGVMNFVLSGSFFPNTFAAKIKYYSGGAASDFPAEFLQFVAGGNGIITAVAGLFGFLSLLPDVIRRRPQRTLISALWIAGMFLVYWKNLPYLFQEGRYMMPILPFLLLLAIDGLRFLFTMLKKLLKPLQQQGREQLVLTLVMLFVFGLNSAWTWEGRASYAEDCKYITDRQVKAADWIREHLPEDAVIATHDIGAIGFYSGRKIADMVGLVSPAMIQNLGNLDGLLQFLGTQGVTHLAVLRDWFEVTNQNPLFQTNELEPEVMEVFAFDKQRTHITPTSTGTMTATALRYIAQGNLRAAWPLLLQSVREDPENSRTHFGLGLGYLIVSKFDDAERELVTATRLHPSYRDAELALANLAADRGEGDSALAQIGDILERNPTYAPAYRSLENLASSSKVDSLRARELLKKYEYLAGAAELPQRNSQE